MKAIVTGSFDPFTLGHLEIVKSVLNKFEVVYVVALINENKSYMFTMEEKKKIIELSVGELEGVIVDAYDGLTADYMHKNGIKHIVRGIRNSEDLEYEQKLANKMKEYDKDFETIFINCKEEYSNISSTSVKDAIKNNKDLTELMHPKAILYLKNK
jgi:pantetheine-phosphate adenylyltransferase